MKLKDLLPEGFIVLHKVKKDIKNVNIGPSSVWYKDKADAEKYLKSLLIKSGLEDFLNQNKTLH